MIYRRAFLAVLTLGTLAVPRAAQAQRQSDDDFLHLVFRKQASQGLQIAPLVLTLNSFEPLGGNSQRIRDGHPNPFRADVEGQYPVPAALGRIWV